MSEDQVGYFWDKLTEIGIDYNEEGWRSGLGDFQRIELDDNGHTWIKTHNLLAMLIEQGGRYWHKGSTYRVYFKDEVLRRIARTINPPVPGPFSFHPDSAMSGKGHFFCLTARRWSIGIDRLPDDPQMTLATAKLIIALEEWTGHWWDNYEQP